MQSRKHVSHWGRGMSDGRKISLLSRGERPGAVLFKIQMCKLGTMKGQAVGNMSCLHLAGNAQAEPVSLHEVSQAGVCPRRPPCFRSGKLRLVAVGPSGAGPGAEPPERSQPSAEPGWAEPRADSHGQALLRKLRWQFVSSRAGAEGLAEPPRLVLISGGSGICSDPSTSRTPVCWRSVRKTDTWVFWAWVSLGKKNFPQKQFFRAPD